MLISNQCYFFIIALLFYCCYTDIFYREIKNKTTLLILIITLIGSFINGVELNWFHSILLLIVGAILFYFSILGAGDVKLISVLMLSIHKDFFVDFIIIVTFFGFPLVVVVIIFNKLFHTRRSLPYGLAITAGYITISFFMPSYYNNYIFY